MNLIINGGKKILGEVDILGSKNAFFPLVAACCLTENDVILNNIPLIEDAIEKIELMEQMNASIQFHNVRAAKINTKHINPLCINFNSRIRTSILFLGVFLGRFGYCKIPHPKGDKIGVRKTNFHIDALTQMGAEFVFTDHYMEAKTNGLKGIEYTMPFSSNGATHNIILAAALAEGTTIINNASIEPETVSLCYFLKILGVEISGIGQSRIIIEGSHKKLYNKNTENQFSVISDRLQAATYLIAGAITNGDVTIKGENFLLTLGSLLEYLVNIGCEITCLNNSIRCVMKHSHMKKYNISTNIYPGLHTDLQPLFVPLLCCRAEEVILHDSIFDDRFKYISELNKMGGRIEKIDNYTIKILHIDNFISNFNLVAHDIRGGMSVFLASLNANGKSRILNFYQISRGYDNLFQNLGHLGADIDIEYLDLYNNI